MERRIIKTADGSVTVTIPEMNVSYHSKHGAIRESMHVFIEAGFRYLVNTSANQQINVLEMGLGTGLNALLTAIEAEKQKAKVSYTAIEQFPLSAQEAAQLNYVDVLGHADYFSKIHSSVWNNPAAINDFFVLNKIHTDLLDFLTLQRFNLIYYDAFAPNAQPLLWTKEIFERLFVMLEEGGVLVTYCSKGDVRRAMTEAGFTVKKLPGPPGKREMLRATKF